jgi:Lhr-like helicase
MSIQESFQLDALHTEKELRRRLVDFAESRSFLRDNDLMAACRTLWSGPEPEGGLVGQLWIEGIFPSATSGKTLKDLVNSGTVSESLVAQLESSGAFQTDRPLYAHQTESIIASTSTPSGSRPGIVITAGTGAGKTEAFLLPLLNDLFTAARPKKNSTKVIILYPMNALVNDQVERIYRWLKGQKKITLFHMTSETPEDTRRANDVGYPKFEPCRLRTRQQARENPPDILITNYSMLEYMLCRPQDAPFFSPDLRTFVLDEAHLYSGTLAAEISLLLKRVFLRCGRDAADILMLATSATLGEGVNEFAAKIFSKDVRSIIHIDGAVDRRSFPKASPSEVKSLILPDHLVSIAGKSFTNAEELVKAPDIVSELANILTGLVSADVIRSYSAIPEPAVFLFHTLAHAPLVQRLEDVLFNARDRGVVALSAIAADVFGDNTPVSCAAIVALLQLCARAREEFYSYPLIPHKAHVLVRASGTMSACLNPSCTCTSNLRLPGGGRLVADIRTACPDCNSKMLTLARCSNCGEWLLAGIYSSKDNSFTPRSRWNTSDIPPNLSYRFAVPAYRGGNGTEFSFDLGTGRCENEGSSITLRNISECISCSEPITGIKPMGIPDALGLPVSVEAVFSEMPVYPEDKRYWLPGRGRRLLIFSDSRKEAARLGPLLTDQHELQMTRAVIMETFKSSVSDDRSRQRLERDIQRLAEELNDDLLSDNERRDIQQELGEKHLRREALLHGGSMKDWLQLIKIHPLLSEFFCRPNGAKHRADLWSQKDWDHNRNEVAKGIEEILVREFVSPTWTQASLETLGLAEIVYPGLNGAIPPRDLLAILPSSIVREHITKSWPDLLATICDTIRDEGAITVGDAEKDREWPYFPIGRWMSMSERFSAGYLVPFKGSLTGGRESRRNKYCRNVLIAAGCSVSQSEALHDQFMESLYRQLLEFAGNDNIPWLEKSSRQHKNELVGDAIRLKFFPLAVRIPLTLFRCSMTGTVFSRSVLGCSLLANTSGTLAPVSLDEMRSDPYFGRAWKMFMDEKAFRMGIWAEEHSAQLDHNETRRLQELFIAGARNVLSATTTLEVGIDIGGLSGVVLANVPPGKANYQQRGGRAGRRSDGSSIVMTYCRSTAYDQSVFHDFSHFFRQPLRKPNVLLERARFAKRHLHAFLLGEFYGRIQPKDLHVGAMDAFGKIGEFCSAPVIMYIDNKTVARSYEIENLPSYSDKLISVHPWWNPDGKHLAEQFVFFLNYLANNPQEIISKVKILLEATPGLTWLDSWPETIELVVADFENVIKPWLDDYASLLDAWRTERDSPKADIRAMNAMFFQAKSLRNSTVIEELGSRRFLPRYGFPIGLQSLIIPSVKGKNDPISLQRDGIVAISEYVPGSSVLVGGKTYTSHGLQKSWGFQESGVGRRAWMYKCLSGHVFHRPFLDNSLTSCAVKGCLSPLCGAPLELLIPRFGYSTALWDPPKWKSSPDRVGATSFSTTSFAHHVTENKIITEFGGITGAVAELCEGGELLAYNSGDYGFGFVICTRCGYSESERYESGTGRDKLPKGFETHAPLSAAYENIKCWHGESGAPVLRHQHLAATHVTDLVQIDFSGVLNVDAKKIGRPIINTIGHALRLAGAGLLEADHRELGMICLPVGPSALDGLQIFDNAAGGAGHIVELMVDSKAWVLRAMQVLRRDDDHHSKCEKGCLHCILTTSSQRDWETGNLVRREAYNLLELLLNGDPIAEVSPALNNEFQSVEPQRSAETRLARLRGKNSTEKCVPKTKTLDSEWLQLADDAAKGFKPLLSVLNTMGIELPVCGFDLVDEAGIVVATAEICWPSRKVAVLSESDELRDVRITGWTILKFHDADAVTVFANKLQNILVGTA